MIWRVAAAELKSEGKVLFGSKRKCKLETGFGGSLGHDIALDRNLASYMVQPLVTQHDGVPVNPACQSFSAMFPRGAAHFKQIRKIGIETDAHGNFELVESMVHEQKFFKT